MPSGRGQVPRRVGRRRRAPVADEGSAKARAKVAAIIETDRPSSLRPCGLAEGFVSKLDTVQIREHVSILHRGEKPMADELKALSARIEALEKMLSQVAQPAQVSDITAEEMRAFRKVRDIVAFDPDTVCGINECFKCVSICRVNPVCVAVCRVCRVCDFECTCGPCNMGGRGGRFGGLGE